MNRFHYFLPPGFNLNLKKYKIKLVGGVTSAVELATNETATTPLDNAPPEGEPAPEGAIALAAPSAEFENPEVQPLPKEDAQEGNAAQSDDTPK